LVVAIVLGCLTAGCGRQEEPAPEEVHPAPVTTVSAKKIALGEWSELLGTTQPLPNRSGRITAVVEGRVLSLLGDANTSSPLAPREGSALTEGQQVQAGQVVVQLDDRILRANREKLLASLKDLDEQKRQADYAEELAQIDVNSLMTLAKSNSTNGGLPLASRVQLDKAHVAVKDAQSKQRAAQAKKDIALAELKALDEQLALYRLRSPIAGTLGLVQIVPGQTLAIGTTVAEVVNLDDIDVLCFVPPHTASRLVLNQTARLSNGEKDKTDLSPQREQGPPLASGKVVFIAVQAQPETGNFAVKVRFPNRDLHLRANSLVRALVLTKPEQQRWTVPDTAVLEDQDPPGVVIAEQVETKKDDKGEEEKIGKARKLQATLGVRDRHKHLVEILELKDPEKKEPFKIQDVVFIKEGGFGLHNGDPIKLSKDEG